MAYEFRRPDPGSVIFRDGLMYHWPEGGEWLPVLSVWHVDEAEDVGIEVREVDDPPASEPVPVVEVPVAERQTSPESPDDLMVALSDDAPQTGRRPKAVSRTVRLPRTQVYEVGAVEYVDEVVETAVAHDEYVPDVPLPRQLVVTVPEPDPDAPVRVRPSRQTVEPAPADESSPGQVTPTDETVEPADPAPSQPGTVRPSSQTVEPSEPSAASAPARVEPNDRTVTPEPAPADESRRPANSESEVFGGA